MAVKWSEEINKSAVVISKCVADSTYLNLWVQPSRLFSTTLGAVLVNGDNFGSFSFGAGKKIFCEYSSPNIAKPFHAGHLRSTVIGSFLAKLHASLGYEVISENYLGDWGKQYGLLAVGFSKWGNSELLKTQPIRHLFEVYVKVNLWARLQDAEPEAKAGEEDKKKDEFTCPFCPVKGTETELRAHLGPAHPEEAAFKVHDEARKYFKRMEDGDENALGLWREMREMSIVEYKKIYDRLNVSFQVYGGESLQSQGMVKQLAILEEKKMLTSPPEAKGAKLIDLEKYKLGKVVVVKQDGATLYITRDIAAAASRWDAHHFDHMFYVVACQQDLHFQQLFKTLELMGYDWASRCTHINFGMVRGMKTRTGQVVFLTDILDEAKAVMLEQMKASTRSKFDEIEDPEMVADVVGLSAVVVQDLTASRRKDYTFEWDRVTSFEGDTGPYLQYNHARLYNLEVEVKLKRGWDVTTLRAEDIDVSVLTEPQARALCFEVARFPYAVYGAFASLEASNIVAYMFDVCHTASAAHHDLNVIKAETEREGKARLALFHAARLVIGKGLAMLGLHQLKKM